MTEEWMENTTKTLQALKDKEITITLSKADKTESFKNNIIYQAECCYNHSNELTQATMRGENFDNTFLEIIDVVIEHLKSMKTS